MSRVEVTGNLQSEPAEHACQARLERALKCLTIALMSSRKPDLLDIDRRYGIARVISKQGRGSRTQAARWVQEGRVRVNGRVVLDVEFPVRAAVDQIEIDGTIVPVAQPLALMLNKPRGLVTTTRDERGRATVYSCFVDAKLPWMAPVGRLDKASEGLLLFSNDPKWAAGITSPQYGIEKTYHVQIDRLPAPDLLISMERGLSLEGGFFNAKSARCLRTGARNSWLEIVLDEGRNRQIRRLLAGLDVAVLRLVRVAIGPLKLGDLPKGKFRTLSRPEMESLNADAC